MNEDIFLQYFTGYVDVELEDDFYFLYRFSREQRAFYQSELDWFGLMSRCQAGMKICVDHCSLISFDFKCKKQMKGEVCFESVTKDGAVRRHVFSVTEELGRAEMYFDKEDVMVYFPYAVQMGIKNVVIHGDAAAKKERVILSFGDSITQGFTTEEPSQTYPSILGRDFDADVYNFGISGFVMKIGILNDIKYLPTPWIITFAYGTNDWAYEREYQEDMQSIFYELAMQYPTVPIFILVPIARGNETECLKYGTLEDVRNSLCLEASKYPNFKVLESGRDMNIEMHFLEDATHPNSIGMRYLGDKISADIAESLKTWER